MIPENPLFVFYRLSKTKKKSLKFKQKVLSMTPNKISIAYRCWLLAYLLQILYLVYIVVIWKILYARLLVAGVLLIQIFYEICLNDNNFIRMSASDSHVVPFLSTKNELSRMIQMRLNIIYISIYVCFVFHFQNILSYIFMVGIEILLLSSSWIFYSVKKDGTWKIINFVIKHHINDDFLLPPWWFAPKGRVLSILVHFPSLQWSLWNTVSLQKWQKFISIQSIPSRSSVVCDFKPISNWYRVKDPKCIIAVFHCSWLRNFFMLQTSDMRFWLFAVDPKTYESQMLSLKRLTWQDRRLKKSLNPKKQIYCKIEKAWVETLLCTILKCKKIPLDLIQYQILPFLPNPSNSHYFLH